MRRKINLILVAEKPIGENRLLRLHWSKRNAEVQRVKLAVRAALDPESAMFSGPVAITVTAYFKNRSLQLDASNIAAKLYEDGLISWLIEDDKPEFVRSIKSVSLIDQDRPRVEIEIEEV